MRSLFIESRRKFDESEINFNLLDKIPGKIVSLTATIQYIGLIPKVKKYLESEGKKVLLKRGAYCEGHIIGCNSSAFDINADTFLVITDGKFHAMNNAIQLQKEVYIFNTKSLEKIEQKEIEQHNRKTEGKKKIFLTSTKVGIIVSSKWGQHNKNAEKIKEKIKKLGKEVYIFEADNIVLSELENFPTIQIWVNTACFGVAGDDKRIINLTDILEFI